MPALNRVQLIGRLGKDPESKFTPRGKQVVHFAIAISNRWTTRDGDTRETSEWVSIEVWERLAAVCQEYLKKGSLVYVEGRLKTDKYEDDGETRYFTKVVASTVQFLSDSRVEDSLMKQESLFEEEDIALTEAP